MFSFPPLLTPTTLPLCYVFITQSTKCYIKTRWPVKVKVKVKDLQVCLRNRRVNSVQCSRFPGTSKVQSSYNHDFGAHRVMIGPNPDILELLPHPGVICRPNEMTQYQPKQRSDGTYSIDSFCHARVWGKDDSFIVFLRKTNSCLIKTAFLFCWSIKDAGKILPNSTVSATIKLLCINMKTLTA